MADLTWQDNSKAMFDKLIEVFTQTLPGHD